MLWSPAPWMERKKGLPSQELDRISLNSRPMFKWVVTSLHCSGAFLVLVLQSRPGQRPGPSPQCTDCIGRSAPLLELLSYISCFYIWIVWVTLVGIFWTVAPCFPFRGKCSVLSVLCSAVHNGECCLALNKRRSPLVWRICGHEGEASCCQAHIAPSKPLKTSGVLLQILSSLPKLMVSERKEGGFFGTEMRQRSPCFSVRAADPQLKALSRFSV